MYIGGSNLWVYMQANISKKELYNCIIIYFSLHPPCPREELLIKKKKSIITGLVISMKIQSFVRLISYVQYVLPKGLINGVMTVVEI